ncbi:unnamed protein product [Schistocephalus solidus]|uniref:Uncharacterized protein n=1 Tax=Schistocephalus solidus TaxID=70667 RepID=A0A183TKU2_SCHSO|nr:unnamed protein product [Schistocephalus solidus]
MRVSGVLYASTPGKSTPFFFSTVPCPRPSSLHFSPSPHPSFFPSRSKKSYGKSFATSIPKAAQTNRSFSH